MKTFKKKLQSKAFIQSLPSESEDATLNRAGGVAFDINDPSVKLITMTGGSFFMEPRYYDSTLCVPKRQSDGKFSKLQRRIEIVNKNASSIVKMHDID